MSVAAAQQIVLEATASGSVSNFYKEASYQQAWLTGDVYGIYTIPVNSTVCDYTTIASAAKQAATQNGVNLSAYGRYVYAFPQNSCGWWGLGTVGGNPSQSWINGSFQNQVVAHEVGHGLGLWHSHGLNCGTKVIGSTSPTSGCTNVEYGDAVDTMGGALPPAHYNAPQKELLGWLDYGSSPAVTSVQATGVYTLDPYETVGGTNPKALKVRTPAGDWYYVEYRQPLGFDYHAISQSYSNVKTGVVVHLWSQQDPNAIYLLDMTPGSSYGFGDAALDVGQSFTDTTAGISIAPVWANGTAGVNVTVGSGGSCVRSNPTVTVSSASQQGLAGTTLTYTVSVTNNDSGCSASSFTQSAAVPSGWKASIASTTLSLAPGATASTTMQVTSPASATAGSYTVSATSTNSSASSYHTSASATCQVMTSCFRSRPAVKVSPATQQGTALKYSVAVTNNDSACTSR
jgi:hypothetical protein